MVLKRNGFLTVNFINHSKNSLGGIALAMSLLLCGEGTAAAQNENFPFQPGETIHFAIKKMGVKVGEATVVFNGLERFLQQVHLSITFTAKAFNFFDREKIYLDKQTYYPLIVARDLNIFGKKESIVEIYDSKSGEIFIGKTVKHLDTRQTIKKEGQIDNIYCFLYRFRQNGAVSPGSFFSMNLPTRDVTIQYLKQEKMKVAGKVYQTMYLQSDPKEYQIWFDSSEKRIPLRIDGAMGIASMSLILSEYKP